jgi:hypothetical protein
MKAEWMIVTIKCIYFIWNITLWKWLSIVLKSFTFTDFASRKLEYRQELVLLLVQAVNNGFLNFISLKLTAKVEQLTWIVRSQDLSSNSLMRGNSIRGSLRINWIIHPNLTFACIIWKYNRLVKVLQIFPYYKYCMAVEQILF